MRCMRIGILLLVAFGAVALGGLAAEPASCSACKTDQQAFTEGSCPYTITIQCWCEIPDIYICCIRQTCEPAGFGGPCTDCYFFRECYWQDCDTDPPEIAGPLRLQHASKPL